MTSLYPGALDNFAETSPTYLSDPDTTGRVHQKRHDDVESGLEAVQGFIGARKSAAAVPAQVYWDESAGRRMFVWDTINQRFQLAYSDTGWRKLATTANVSSGDLFIRRIATTIHVKALNLRITGANVPVFTPIPYGFNAIGAVLQPVGLIASATSGMMQFAGSDIVVIAPALAEVSGEVSYATFDPWPTALPGEAYGGIPTSARLPADDTPSDIDPDIPTGLTVSP